MTTLRRERRIRRAFNVLHRQGFNKHAQREPLSEMLEHGALYLSQARSVRARRHLLKLRQRGFRSELRRMIRKSDRFALTVCAVRKVELYQCDDKLWRACWGGWFNLVGPHRYKTRCASRASVKLYELMTDTGDAGESYAATLAVMNLPSIHFDREGKPLAWGAYLRRIADRNYVSVALDTIGDVEVSTVWLGINHAFLGGPPLIFETMIFREGSGELHARYSAEEQAREGHAQALNELRSGLH